MSKSAQNQIEQRIWMLRFPFFHLMKCSAFCAIEFMAGMSSVRSICARWIYFDLCALSISKNTIRFFSLSSIRYCGHIFHSSTNECLAFHIWCCKFLIEYFPSQKQKPKHSMCVSRNVEHESLCVRININSLFFYELRATQRYLWGPFMAAAYSVSADSMV